MVTQHVNNLTDLIRKTKIKNVYKLYDFIYNPPFSLPRYSCGYYLDPFREDDFWIHSGKFYNYLLLEYNITYDQLCNILNGIHANYVHKCETCGCHLHVRRLTEGFSSRFCSSYCRSISPEFRLKSSINMSSLNQNEEFKKRM